MKILFPNEDWLTDTPHCEPRQVVAPNRRQQRRAALANERRSPTCVHLILKPSTCAVRRGVRAARLQLDERSAPRGGSR
jgi:hypothetical protein